MVRIPTDNYIRALLDPVPPQLMFPNWSVLVATLTAGKPPPSVLGG